MISYKSPLVVLAAVCLFLYFEKMKISPFWEKVIGFFSPMAFSVYLIHNHPLIATHFIEKRFVEYAALPWIVEIIAVLGTAVLINLACYAIDFLRLGLFKRLQIRKRLDLLEEQIKMRINMRMS